MNFVQTANLIGCHGNIKGKFSKNYSKIFSSEAMGGWSWNLAYMFYINCFLLLLPMCFFCYGTIKFPKTYNGKSGNWHLFLCYCRYFGKSFTEMFLDDSSTNHLNFCPNHWLWLVAMAIERLNFRKRYSKIFFSEAIRGMKLKLCINVYDISLYISCIFYCYCPRAFVAMAT